MSSNTVTPSVTVENSAIFGRPSFVQRSLSSKLPQAHSSVFTSLTSTLPSEVTQAKSSTMEKSASKKSLLQGTITSETASRLSTQASRIETTQATSTHKNSITFTTISTETSSVMSSIPSVTSSQQTTVELFLSKPSQTSSAIVVRSSNTQASSQSQIFIVTLRVTASASSSVTSSGVVSVASSFQSIVTPSSDTSRLFITTSVKSRTSSVRTRLILVTQSSHLLSSETKLTSNLAPSSYKASSKQLSISASFSTMVSAKRIHSSRRIQIPETSVIRPSSPSATHKSSITFTTISTETSSVMSSIPSVTSSQQTTVELFSSKPSQTSSAIVVRSSNTQASSQSQIFIVTLRGTASASSSVTSSGVVSVASSFQSIVIPSSVLPSSDTSRLFITTSVKSRTTSVRTRLILVTQSSHLLLSETELASKLAPSSYKASSRQLSISASFSTMVTAKRIHSSRRIQIPETSVIRPSSPSATSSEISVKPSFEIRISTRFKGSTASFVSSKFGVERFSLQKFPSFDIVTLFYHVTISKGHAISSHFYFTSLCSMI